MTPKARVFFGLQPIWLIKDGYGSTGVAVSAAAFSSCISSNFPFIARNYSRVDPLDQMVAIHLKSLVAENISFDAYSLVK